MFALLPDTKAKWPEGDDDGWKFLGYQLDDQQRPTFRYRFLSIEIHDFPTAIPGDVDANFRRTLTLKSEKRIEGLWFRAWTADRIEQQENGFVAGGKVTLRFAEDTKAVVRESGGKRELLVPIQFNGGEATIVEEILW